MIKDFNKQYFDILKEVKERGFNITNARTAQQIRVSHIPFTITLDLTEGYLPLASNRKYSPHIAASEAAWIISGEQSTEWLSKHTQIWQQFADINGNINSAYGYRWRHAFGRDQLNEAIEVLRTDDSSRQIVLSMWDASSDGLLSKSKPNVPCPVMLILNVISNKLNAQLIIRSSDLFVGLPYDVMTYAFILKSIADELRMGLGIYSIYLAHPHIYSDHLQFIDLKNWNENSQIKLFMPAMSISDIEKDKDNYMMTVRQLFDGCSVMKNHFNPKPKVFL